MLRRDLGRRDDARTAINLVTQEFAEGLRATRIDTKALRVAARVHVGRGPDLQQLCGQPGHHRLGRTGRGRARCPAFDRQLRRAGFGGGGHVQMSADEVGDGRRDALVGPVLDVGLVQVVEQRKRQVGRRAFVAAAAIELAALGLLHQVMSPLEFKQRLAALVRRLRQ